MIRAGFLSREDRADLIALARDGSAAHRLGRRANALVLLDDGLSCEEVAKVLFLDDDTVRRSFRGAGDGAEGLCDSEPAPQHAPNWRLHREGVRHRLREPLGADRAVTSSGPGIPQA